MGSQTSIASGNSRTSSRHEDKHSLGMSPQSTGSGGDSDSDVSSASEWEPEDVFEKKSSVSRRWTQAVSNRVPLMVDPGRGTTGLAFVPTPAGGWGTFTAKDARGRA